MSILTISWPFLVLFSVLVFYRFKKYLAKRDLKGKHVMISGGSSGIGLSVAKEVLRMGANVSIVARDESKLRKAKEQLQKIKESSDKIQGKIQTFSVDVASGKLALHELVQSAETSFGHVFMLVNCAGYAKASKFEDLSVSDVKFDPPTAWTVKLTTVELNLYFYSEIGTPFPEILHGIQKKGMMDVNFVGSFLLTQEVVRSMKRAEEGGSIVLVSSQAGLFGIYGFTAYSAAKGALVKFAEALHMELKPHNISVTVNYPPDTDTPGLARENENKPTATTLISENSGLVQPDEVARNLIDDALLGKFSSYIGLEGFMLSTLCGGMSPITDIPNILSQIFFSGIFRLVSIFYLWNFDRIVSNEHLKRIQSKKRE